MFLVSETVSGLAAEGDSEEPDFFASVSDLTADAAVAALYQKGSMDWLWEDIVFF